MLTRAFQIQFHSALHLSNAQSDYSKSEKILHSDTLTAAIMHTWNAIGKSEWIENYGFVLSSLFPFTNKNILFFPKPYVGFNQEKLDIKLAKKAKKIQYIDFDYFKKLLSQERTDIAEKDYKGSFLTAHDIKEKFMTTSERVRVLRPRDEKEPTIPYYVDEIRFAEDSGLWGLIHFESEKDLKKFEVAMQVLETNGLGTDRSVGYGQFTFSWIENIHLDFKEYNSGYTINLSLYAPESHEELLRNVDSKARYDTLKRGGWLSEPFGTLRKKSVLMFKEGSILKNSNKVAGTTLNVTPNILKANSTVLRSGKAIFLSVNLK